MQDTMIRILAYCQEVDVFEDTMDPTDEESRENALEILTRIHETAFLALHGERITLPRKWAEE